MSELKKIGWMIKKELLSLKRHPTRLFAILIFPLIMILVFGYGMGGTLTDLPVVVVSQSSGDLTDLTLDAIKNTDTYNVVQITDNPDEAKTMVDKGDVKAAIILPPNYDNSDTTQQKSVTFYLDSTDQMAAQALTPVTTQLFSQIAQESTLLSSQPINTTSNSTDSDIYITSSQSESKTDLLSSIKYTLSTIQVQIYKIYGNIEYIDFLVPAVLGMTIMMSCVNGMGSSIAGERETGELSRLFMTPTSVKTVIAGKIASKVLIEIIRALLLLIFAILLFGVTVKGGFISTFIIMFLGALCFVGLGVMISAKAATQEDYMQLTMPITMPLMFISGVFYPVETMPWIIQKIAYLSPLTYLGDAMRNVMLKGMTLLQVWPQILALIIFTLIFFAIGVKTFNRDV